jgi:hypothetical protein
MDCRVKEINHRRGGLLVVRGHRRKQRLQRRRAVGAQANVQTMRRDRDPYRPPEAVDLLHSGRCLPQSRHDLFRRSSTHRLLSAALQGQSRYNAA